MASAHRWCSRSSDNASDEGLGFAFSGVEALAGRAHFPEKPAEASTPKDYLNNYGQSRWSCEGNESVRRAQGSTFRGHPPGRPAGRGQPPPARRAGLRTAPSMSCRCSPPSIQRMTDPAARSKRHAHGRAVKHPSARRGRRPSRPMRLQEARLTQPPVRWPARRVTQSRPRTWQTMNWVLPPTPSRLCVWHPRNLTR